MIIYQIKTEDASFFLKKVKKNIFMGNSMVILEGEMMKLWVEQKKRGLIRLDFMQILEY